ncbi:MAG TPA: RHS repeat-associated core domain-containing protein, partial [Chitinophagaceae bacterium]
VVSGWKSDDPATNSNTDVLADLFNLLSSGVAGASGGKATQLQLQNSNSGLNAGLNDFLTSQTTSGTKPKAYVNWILLDEQFKIVSSNSGFEQVGDGGAATIHYKPDLPISKNGYLYIYTSNDATNVDVFFDNLQVTHVRGPLLEETHYYPFGLIQAGISSKAFNFGTPENKFKFNGVELSNKEFIDGSGLEIYEMPSRSYDPQIGRFWQIDPVEKYYESLYAGMGNNPICYIDPSGADTTFPSIGGGSITLPYDVKSGTTYKKEQYWLKGTTTIAPVEEGQLRSFESRQFGVFSANWQEHKDGTIEFVGYLNSKGQSYNAAVTEYNQQLQFEQNIRDLNAWFQDPVNQAFLIAAPLELARGNIQSKNSLSKGNPSLVTTEAGGVNLYKSGSQQAIKGVWKIGDRFLYLPNKGSSNLNWKQNSGALRREMRMGLPIFDSYRNSNGSLIQAGGPGNPGQFLNAERYLLSSRGWTYNPSIGAWVPGK